MIFGELIREALEKIEGGVAGVIMGTDGIALDSFSKKEGTIEIQTAGIEYAAILKEVRRIAGELKTGGVREFSVIGESHILIVEPVNDEYFFAMAVLPEGNFGKARYTMKMTVPKIRKEL